MNKFKKFLAVALSLCLIGGGVSSLGACEKEEPQTPPPVVPQTVDFTVSVKTDKGVAVEGVQFVLWANLDNSKTDLETNSEGKATVNVAVGEYDLELNSESLPEMHFPDKYKWTLDISESVTSLEIVVENVAPDGTLEKPYYFAVSDENEASVTLPANATVYYELRNLSGASMFIQTQGVEVVYKGVTYTYDAQKNAVEVPLEKTDTNSRVRFALVNKTGAELIVNAILQVPEGSLENPIVLTTLGEVTVEVKGTGQIYYQWAASEAGTFKVTSNSQDSYISVTNKTQVSSETVINREGQDQTLKTTIEIAVNAGDVISIEASAFGAENGQEYSYEINFGFQASLS
ncbi:MAG: hypothetical protein IKL76_03030 [Clostridia bacterium]|nr:hypothetical protein [Clostridia bacterium]